MELMTFAVVMAVGQLTPGPDMLLILKNTLNRGLSTGLATIAGIGIGIIIHVTFIICGFATLIETFPRVMQALQIVGASYLLWIAYQLLRSTHPSPASENATPSAYSITHGQAFREGLITNLTNIKVVILFSSLLAPVVASHGTKVWLFGLVILIEAAIIWPLFAWLMQHPAVRHRFLSHQRRLNVTFGLLLIVFASRLLSGL